VEPASCSLDYCDFDWSNGLILPVWFVYIVKDTGQVIWSLKPPFNTALIRGQAGIYSIWHLPIYLALFIGLIVPAGTAIWYQIAKRQRKSKQER